MTQIQDQDLLTGVDSPDIDLEEPVEITDETVRWHARDASFMAGRWSVLAKRIPRFVIEDFKATVDGPVNPYIRTVIRQPLTVTEQPIPVGVVSYTYSLAQHSEVVEKCLEAISAHGIDPKVLRCEVGLTPLGEWMNFRAYFPDEFSHRPKDGNNLSLRLECFNSVEGSSRLVILLGWFRLICTNGMIIGETKAELRDSHDENLDLTIIPEIIAKGLVKVKADLGRLGRWEETNFKLSTKFESWIDGHLSEQWGKKAACRVLHICRTGQDVEIADLFAAGKASEKPINRLDIVPGAPNPAKNLYDVCQALSWIATQRNSAEERLKMQTEIPKLLAKLGRHLKAA